MSGIVGSVAIVGAGVFGLSAGLALARAGARVTLYDPADPAGSASGVAAGMLAPAFEAALDPVSAGHFDLFTAGRDGWRSLLDSAKADLSLIDTSGALFLADDADAAGGLHARLTGLGATVEAVTPRQARALAPGLEPGDRPALFTPDDWRLSPGAMLAVLSRAFTDAGGRTERAPIQVRAGRLCLDGGRELSQDRVVIAAGAEGVAFAAAAPELAVLRPIKGQILHFAGGPATGPIVRSSAGYLTPHATGAAAGATMEPGLSDRRTEPSVLGRLRADAERLFPGLADVPVAGRAGVRAGTPDGLPMVGFSGGSARVLLAAGARRNGWLLAPLVAAMIARAVAGEDLGPFRAMLSPGRFSI